MVSEIDWPAGADAGIESGFYGQFTVIAGRLPDAADALTFRAIQTYSDNSVVAWIEQAAAGSTAQSDQPAATLNLTAGASVAAPGTSTTAPAAPASSESPAGTAPISAASVTAASAPPVRAHRHHFRSRKPVAAPGVGSCGSRRRAVGRRDAAAGIGDRRIAGRALARVALLRSALARAAPSAPSLGGAVPVLGIGGLQVAARVQALLEPARRSHMLRLAALGKMSLTVSLLGAASLAHIHQVIEAAAQNVKFCR